MAPPATTSVSNLVAPANPPQLDPALLQLSTDAFTLGPGDKMEIEFIGDLSSRTSVEVGPDGKIYFYLLPGIDVWGLTLPQARDLIAEKSEMFLRKKPGVAITLREVNSKRIWVLGHLNNPGIFPMSGPVTLLDAVAEAGGPTAAIETNGLGSPKMATADLRHSFVLRRGQMIPVDFQRLIFEGDLSQNIYLQPGDFVYLPSAMARTVHVLGAVALPGAVASDNGITLIQTIASAGGTIKDAYLSHVAVVRGSLTQPTISIVDYLAIVKGTAPDVFLEPHDIVYVPYTPYRTLTRYMDLILRTFVQTVGVNEGAHAVSSKAGSVGVNVQVNPGIR
ncbi:MAG TPA: SLBB domain-containing protein [Opitutaceae bacterium]|nr:SLBB domain-containing protein [Opitutaceae bacterium]